MFSAAQGDVLKLWDAVLKATSTKWTTPEPWLVIITPPPPFGSTVEWISLVQTFSSRVVLVPAVSADLAVTSPVTKAASSEGIKCFPMYSHEAGIFHAVELAWAETATKGHLELHLGQAADAQVFEITATTIGSHDNPATSFVRQAIQSGETILLQVVQQAEASSVRHVDVVRTPWLLQPKGSGAPAWHQVCTELERRKTLLVASGTYASSGQAPHAYFAVMPGQGGEFGILQQLRCAEDIVHTASSRSNGSQQSMWDAAVQDALDALPNAPLAPLSLSAQAQLQTGAAHSAAAAGAHNK